MWRKPKYSNLLFQNRLLQKLTMMMAMMMMMMMMMAVVVSAKKQTSGKKNLSDLDYISFPLRKSEEAAVVEWGHSAVISALEAAVAGFGPQTSRGAFFEVETSVILSNPIDGDTDKEKLENADEIHGNMLVMTNGADLSGVHMAKLAQNSGAAALMVVNVQVPETPDFIYSLQPETEEEAAWAKEHIDIPVIMVSLSSGNVLTSAQNPEINNGMPDRIRLYAGGDRPFFEDSSSKDPMVYLIHNLLTDAECDSLLSMANGKTEFVDDSVSNILEGVPASSAASSSQSSRGGGGKIVESGVERIYLWKGALKGHEGKAIDERMEQVTGYPTDHFSDFQLNKFSGHKARIGAHYDELPGTERKPMATITIFLNDVEEGLGGEIVYPSADPPLRIRPKKGMAVVHHNLDHNNHFDTSSIHAELPYFANNDDGSTTKWTAKRWVYVDPLTPSQKYILPILAAPLGGKLPSAVKKLYEIFIEKFGSDVGAKYFDQFLFVGPILLLLGVASLISTYIANQSSNKSKEKKPKKVKKKKKAPTLKKND